MKSTHRKPYGLWQRFAAMVLVAVLCMGVIGTMAPGGIKAQAGLFSTKHVSIQTTIDSSNWKIVSAVVYEKIVNKGVSPTNEDKRMGNATLKKLQNAQQDFSVTLELLNGMSNPTSAGENEDRFNRQYAILTFPNQSGVPNRDYTREDEETALEVGTTLTDALNNAFLFVSGGIYVPNGGDEAAKTSAYKNDMTNFLEAVGDASTQATTSYVEYTTNNGTVAKLYGANNGDSMTIEVNGESQTFVFRVSKGYSDGLQKINWAHLALEAFHNYWLDDENLRVMPDNVYSTTTSDFENILVNLFTSLLRQVRSMLGLWDIDDLVFNTGSRQQPMYVCGIYPANWEKTVWTLFFISEIAAFVVLAFALISNVLRKILSTVNPILRTSLMDQAKDLLVVAFALGALPLLLQLLVNTSFTLTGVFADVIAEGAFDDKFNTMAASSGTLGGIILQFLFTAITISFNVLYVIRSYLLAVLIILSPVFLMFWTMGDNWKNLSKFMMTELLSNIFIQPIHAFVLMLVLLLPISGKPVESLVAFYCIAPVSSIIRGLFFGNAGSNPLRIAQNGVKAFRGNVEKAWRTSTDVADRIAAGAALISSKAGGKGKSGSDGKAEAQSSEGGGGEGRTRGGDTPDTMAARNKSVGGTSVNGAPVFDSKHKTPKEEMMDSIRDTGEAPSVGMDTKLPDVAGSQDDSPAFDMDAHLEAAAPAGVGTDRDVAGPIYPTSRGYGSDMAMSIRRLPQADGSTQFQVSRNEMGEAGFRTFRRNSAGGADFTTTDTGYRGVTADGGYQTINSRGAYSSVDAKNYADMARVFESGTEAEKAALRRAGYDFVGAEMKGGSPTGRFTVSTNQNFANTMGYDPVPSGDGGLNINTTPGSSGELPRTPDVGTILNPESYQRTMEDGSVGYTAAGLALQSEEPQVAGAMPLRQEFQQPDGGYEVPASELSDMGLSIAPADDGNVAVTYDAGIMGMDSDGATVFSQESGMAMPDRQSVASIQQMWDSGSQEDRAQLGSMGIQDVISHENGQVTVVYNDAAQEAMGAQITPSEDGHVIVRPTTPEVPVQTVMPIQTPEPAQGVAYPAEQAVQVKVTPTHVTAPAQMLSVETPVSQPVAVEPPVTSMPTPAPAPAPAPMPIPAAPVVTGTPPVMTADTPMISEPFEKPGSSARMKRRQNDERHRGKGKRSKRGEDWDW